MFQQNTFALVLGHAVLAYMIIVSHEVLFVKHKKKNKQTKINNNK